MEGYIPNYTLIHKKKVVKKLYIIIQLYSKMKFSKPFFKLLKRYVQRYCTGPSDVLNTMKVGNEISVFKTVTKDDILNFAKLTGDYNPIHFVTSNNLVHGALLNGLVSGVLGTKMPGPGTIVVGQTFTFPAPCYAGDIIEIKVQIVSIRKIIKCEYICIANEKKIVLKGNAKLIKKL